jgi:hypothetical protein
MVFQQKILLLIELNKKEQYPRTDMFTSLVDYIGGLTFEKKDSEWLIDNTEEFCQEKAVSMLS